MKSVSQPKKLIVISFTQGSAGVHLMARLFAAGWETWEPLQYAECGHYYTTLYWP